MKQHTDWTDVLRSALRDTEIRPAEGGWERLQRELDAAEPHTLDRTEPRAAKLRRTGWRIHGQRIAAAAAVVLLCIVAGGLLWHAEPETGSDGEPRLASVTDAGQAASGRSRMAERLAEASGWSQGPAADERPDSPRELMARVTPRGETPQTAASVGSAGSETESSVTPAAGSETVPSATSASGSETAVSATPASGSETESSATSAAGSETAVSATRSSGRHQTAARYSGPESDPFEDSFAGPAASSGRTSLSLFAGGGMTGSTAMGNTPLRSYSIIQSDAVSVIGNGNNFSPMQRRDYDESSFRHHLPLSFGFTVRKEFPHGLSLESGVVYTLLRSDVRLRYSSDDVSQKLHFIGIPLRMNWQFVEQGRFSAYLGAGGMVEKCVSAKFGSEAVDEEALQWSVAAALGAQYRLADQVGLYFEPEASYYLTDTELRTSRSDAPLSLTLRLGVRVLF